MDSNKKKTLRHKLFRHLDGIVIAPTAHALKTQGVTDYLLEHKRVSLDDLIEVFNANGGYLNVALRGLCSQGWLNQVVDNTNNTVHFELNERSESAFKQFYLYEDVVQLLKMSEKYHPRKFEIEPFVELEKIYNSFKNIRNEKVLNSGVDRDIRNQILLHIEGIIVGPTTVYLGIKSMFHKYFMESRFKPEEFHENYEYFERLLNILTDLGWFELENGGTYKFTEYGLFFAKRATAYGVTISYLPTLRKLEELLFGNALIFKSNSESAELHVDREMNVWGSGGAHSAYFKILDKVVIDIFNKPIEEQPKGILDMGCGNGAFIKHLFTVIQNNTLRGEMLDEYPLQLIGVDYNEAALRVSRKNLIEADIWAKVIWGDIGNPELLASDLKDNYDIDLSDLLNVRTFLDHNRVWEQPKGISTRTTNSTG
ncbi:MAG: class I SAM-dependent methyltransferase, partial [Crocinitomicaceae bacterium]|nr:class I SAM-dependent methyltransferase [Crocinitomicaceae bacterium]